MPVSPINAGLMASLVQQNARANAAIARSLERLGSGKRIIRPEDGATEFNLISKLDTQIRGTRQALLNVNDGKALSTTADVSLDNLLTLAYQLRELAQQASDSDLTTAERAAISDEVDAILEEYGNVIDASTYNTKNLLDNTLGTVSLQVGASASSSSQLTFSIGDARSTTLGRLAIYSGAQGGISASLGASSTLQLNGVTVAYIGDDDTSSSGGSYSSIAIANAINAVKGQSGVEAESVGTYRTITVSSQGTFTQTLSSGEFQINGVSITGSSVTDAAALVNLINGNASTTGVTASVTGSGNILLYAADGRNIQIGISNGATNNVFDWINVAGNSTIFSVYTGLSQGSDTTHVGAIRIWSSEAIRVDGTSPSLATGFAAANKTLVGGTAVEYVDLSTEADAKEAIKVLDATIAQISSLRLNVGAVHDRLDASASFLVGSLQTLDDTKGSIQNVDLVEEMTNLVVAQLLQNASLASITQANVSASTVMQLLGSL